MNLSQPAAIQVADMRQDGLVNVDGEGAAARHALEPADDEVVRAETKELSVVVEPEGMLVCGDQDLVANYLDKIRDIAGSGVRAAGIDKKSLADLAAVGATVGAVAAQTSGGLVRLSADSMDLLRQYGAVPGSPGFNRMTVVGADNLFKGQLQWQAVAMAPQAAMAVQLAVVAASLRTAIAAVEQAVDRVQGSVDRILVLAEASLTGDVIGHHDALAQICKTLDDKGALPTADWQSVASLGPALAAGVEKLRNHIKRTLDGFDANAPIQDRSSYLSNAVRDNRLGETLQLLVVAEDSLYLWQRLRIERVRATEPEHLETVVASAREVLAENLARDIEMQHHIHAELDAFAKMKPLEIFRKMSSSNLRKDMASLRRDVDDFSVSRRGQVLDWMDHESPTIADALSAVQDGVVEVGRAVGGVALGLGTRTVDLGAGLLGQVGNRFVRVSRSRFEAKAGVSASDGADTDVT